MHVCARVDLFVDIKLRKITCANNFRIMTKNLFQKLSIILYPLVSIVLILLVWQLLFAYVGSEFIFPSIGATLSQMWQHLCDGTFWHALLLTLGRVLLCFAISLALAIVVGVLAKFVPAVGKVLAPIVAIFRSAPTVAVMVILTLIVPRTITTMIVGLLVVFPMTYTNVTTAIAQVDSDVLQMCSLYNVPPVQQFKFVYFPTVSQYLLGELPATLSFTVKLIISAEILSNTPRSVGGLIQLANSYSNMASMFALTILSVMFATLLDVVLKSVAKKIKGGAR